MNTTLAMWLMLLIFILGGALGVLFCISGAFGVWFVQSGLIPKNTCQSKQSQYNRIASSYS